MKKIGTLIILFLYLTASIIQGIQAQSTPDQFTSIISTRNGISVSPSRIQKVYKVGNKDMLELFLLNNEDTDITLNVTLKSIKLINNNQDLVFERNIEQTVLNWVRNFQNRVTLKPKEKYSYKLEISIDPTTAPGGYMFGVFFESQINSTESSESETLVKQSIGVPVIVNVAGVAGISYGQVSLDRFDIGYNLLKNSIDSYTTILNSSNQIITPIGVLSLKKVNGIGPEEIKVDFNSKASVLNSFSIRDFYYEIPFNQLVFGEYDVSLNFLYGLENNVLTHNSRVLVIPIWASAIILIIVIIIGGKFIRKNRKHE